MSLWSSFSYSFRSCQVVWVFAVSSLGLLGLGSLVLFVLAIAMHSNHAVATSSLFMSSLTACLLTVICHLLDHAVASYEQYLQQNSNQNSRSKQKLPHRLAPKEVRRIECCWTSMARKQGDCSYTQSNDPKLQK